jgi:hypothetical protein
MKIYQYSKLIKVGMGIPMTGEIFPCRILIWNYKVNTNLTYKSNYITTTIKVGVGDIENRPKKDIGR